MNTGPSTPRQTLSYLIGLFRRHGIRPKNKLGQNFLIDLNILDLIVSTAELSREDLVIEVGSGTGSLTARLAAQAGAVLSLELDPTFLELAREAVAGFQNAVLLHTDVLKNKNELNPRLFAALDSLRQQTVERCPDRTVAQSLKIVSNLPYAVATPVISNLLLSELSIERMVVTVQWEIAERLIAKPGTKQYGALSVLVQSVADVTLVRRLPPSVFFPRPQVASAIVSIHPNAAKRAHVGDAQRFRHFLRDLYTHRRKILRSALASLPDGRWSKEEVDQKLAELGLEGTIRAETLDVEQHLRLCAAFG